MEATATREPQWLEEVGLGLSICSQFVLHGNVRDLHLVPVEGALVQLDTVNALWETLRRRGYQFALVFDRSDGLRAHPAAAAPDAKRALDRSLPWLQLAPPAPGRELPPQEQSAASLPDIIRALNAAPAPCALIVENASRLVVRPDNPQENETRLFAACERLAYAAAPRASRSSDGVLFNPVFWLVNRPHDLPDWFSIGNERIRRIAVAEPDFETRRARAGILAAVIQPDLDPKSAAGGKLVEEFANKTEGITLRAMEATAQIAQDHGISLPRIGDAIRSYKVGVPRDPWRAPHLRTRMKQDGPSFLSARVLGQDNAVSKTFEVLARSVTGLSGAQAASSANRPRGVLFFAGPTGVGKTELAKAVSELIFGDKDSYVRFDMSEFSAEHSDARLIGAPPGYIGYDAGGELVNAIRRRPHSVLLFDEIEKAHPRILDKFLQVLEDGRLTDGRGDTVYFSDAIIVFTSNLGIYEKQIGEHGQTEWAQAVFWGTPYPDVDKGVRQGIEKFFRFELKRPELLNRIGENIIVFDFIQRDVAEGIFQRHLDNVVNRVRDAQGLDLTIDPEVRGKLLDICTADLNNGARGISNMLEPALVNPLAREILMRDLPRGARLTVTHLAQSGGLYSIGMSCASG